MAKDYYNVLGVDKNANKEDIKRAYKRLAKKFHPDLNKDSDATEKFKEINEAAAVLGDDKKRAQYDQFGTVEGPGFEGFDFSGFRDFNVFDEGFDFGDIFDNVFGRSGRQRAKRGQDLRYHLEITLEEAAEASKKHIDVPKIESCKRCGGTGAKSSSDIISCPECHGTGTVTRQQRTPFGLFRTTTTCRRCRGEGKIVKESCEACRGEGYTRMMHRLEVDVPAGVDTGTNLRITGEGEPGERGSPPGDLYVTIKVKKHDIFEREEDDIYTEMPINFAQAALGDEVEVPTLTGKAKMKIPPGTQTNTVFRLKGKGIPHLRGYGAGDENIRVIVQVPTKLTKKQKEHLIEFAKELKDQDKGFFSRFKDAFE